MSDQDDNETQGIVFAVLGFVVAGVIALVSGVAIWKSSQSAQAVAQPVAIEAPATPVVAADESDIAPVGDALAKPGLSALRLAGWPPARVLLLCPFQSSVLQGATVCGPRQPRLKNMQPRPPRTSSSMSYS